MKKLLLVLGCVLISAVQLSAQATSTVSGTVEDSSGAALPGAQAQITNVDTNAVRTAQSAEDGAYSFPNLAIGPYRLEVTKEGFTTFVQTGIVLQVNTNPTINVAMQVGAVSQTVEVQANAAMVETQNTGIGQVIQPEQVVDLPLNGRQVTQLVALAGAAVNSSANGLNSNLDYPGSVAIAIAGNQPNATNYMLDGSANMDYRENTGAPLPFPDALTEFRLNTSTVPANEGSRPGGAVNAVTKSGTNTFHGNLFEFLRNGYVNADPRTFPNPSGTLPPAIPDNLKRNQFGGTIGGPIKRDKVFFFYGLQETRQRQNLAPSTVTVPTVATMAGDFTAFNSPTCTGGAARHLATVIPATGSIPAQRLVALNGSGQPIDNKLDPAWLNTPAAKMDAQLATLLPAPDDPVCGLKTYSQYQANNETQQVARVDWQRNSKDTIFGRYFIGGFTQPSAYNPTAPNKLLTETAVTLQDRYQNVSIGDTYIISPAMVSSFRLYFGRTAVDRTSDSRLPTLCTVGAAFGATFTCMNPVSQIDVFTTNAPGSTGWTYENNIGISEEIGWQVASHHLEFGFSGQRIEMNAWGTFNTNPLTTYTTGTVVNTTTVAGCAPVAPPCFTVSSGNSWTGIALAEFVTGNVSALQQGHGQLARDHEYFPALYVQDNWKIGRRLQLTPGLRWDPFLAPVSTYGEVANFSVAGVQANQFSSVYPNAPPGLAFPGDLGFNGKSGVQNHPIYFSPRIGFVFDPTGKGHETIRGGYGLYQDSSVLWYSNDISRDPPWGNTFQPIPLPVNLAGQSQGGGITNIFFGQPGGNPFPQPINPGPSFKFPVEAVVNGVPTPTGTSYVFFDKNIKPTYVQSWSLSLQWQVKANWLLSASYLGNKTSNIWMQHSFNPDVLILPTMTSAQFPAIVNVSGVSANGATGACTLLYAAHQVTLNPCNSAGGGSTSARRYLSMINPAVQGGGMYGGTSAAPNVTQSLGTGSYNGLLVSVQHRLSKGFSVLGNYTWSHCLDTTTIGQDISGGGQDPSNPRGEWGNCDFDRRQIVNVSLVAQAPKFASAWKERIIGNWNASGILTASAGPPFTVTPTSTNYSLIGIGSDRPNVYGNPMVGGPVTANPTLSPAQQAACPTVVHTWTNWFNPCAFGNNPVLGQFGNEGRNSLTGPGSWNFDIGIWRTFPIAEKYHLDFRVEGFNLFNHPNLSTPALALNGSTPGRITGTSNSPRQLQAAIKFSF